MYGILLRRSIAAPHICKVCDLTGVQRILAMVEGVSTSLLRQTAGPSEGEALCAMQHWRLT